MTLASRKQGVELAECRGSVVTDGDGVVLYSSGGEGVEYFDVRIGETCNLKRAAQRWVVSRSTGPRDKLVVDPNVLIKFQLLEVGEQL